MKNLYSTIKALAVIPLILVCCSFSCNNEPLGPVDLTEYPFYLSYTNSPKLSVFHPNTLTMDTVTLPWYPFAGITVSADGKLLYIAQATSIVVVDANSFSFVTELPYFSRYPVTVSPDNKLLAITGSDLIILRTSDYSIVFKDTTQLEFLGGSFSSNSMRFFCPSTVSQDSSYLVYKVDLSDSLYPVSRTVVNIGSVVQVLPSLAEDKWFVYFYYGGDGSFEVYDDVNDSVIYSQYLLHAALGSMALSIDGKFVYYTAPANRFGSGEPLIRIFDVNSNAIDTIIRDPMLCDSTTCSSPVKINFSLEEKWCGILAGGGLFQIHNFFLFDLEEKKIIYRAEQSGQPTYYSNMSTITCFGEANCRRLIRALSFETK